MCEEKRLRSLKVQEKEEGNYLGGILNGHGVQGREFPDEL